jgi:DNA primase
VSLTFTDVRHAAIAIGRELERRMPEGDHGLVMRNAARPCSSTTTRTPRPYDRRGVVSQSPGDGVDTVTWEELRIATGDFMVLTVPPRAVAADPWADIDIAHDLTPGVVRP